MTQRQRSLWRLLQRRVAAATSAYGHQAELARHLGVSRQALNSWLSGTAFPTAENTLQLLQWVEAEEAKQTKSNPGRARTRPGRMTRKRKSTTNEKPKSGQR
jgi:transcriptional regulator with XRE-family HTH domain